MRSLTLVVVVVAAVAISGCGSAEPSVTALAVDRALVAPVPDPLHPGADQAPGTLVGSAGAAYVAIVPAADHAVVYLCDGARSAWFGAALRDGRLQARTTDGSEIDARLESGRASGTVRLRGGQARRFAARPPAAPGTGLFAGTDPALPGYTRRWIVLDGGVRGVSEPAAGDADASGTAQPDQDASASGRTGTGTRPGSSTPGNVRDGSSNTIVAGEGSSSGDGAVRDGSSNTIVAGEGSSSGDGAVVEWFDRSTSR